ncbi:MAG: hypothetical protein WKG07_36130 [Hymenobacter sp.]
MMALATGLAGSTSGRVPDSRQRRAQRSNVMTLDLTVAGRRRLR